MNGKLPANPMQSGRSWAENVSLSDMNTLRLPASSRFFTAVASIAELRQALQQAQRRQLPVLVLGGGSNVVLVDDFPGLCIHIASKGISATTPPASSKSIQVRVQAGENWHGFVSHCLQQGWHGLENLALIPGTVGAAPIQNIGAYGVEIKDYLLELTALDRQTLELKRFTQQACGFAYRDSFFKSQQPDRYIICELVFELSLLPVVNLHYAALKQALADHKNPQPRDVFNAVVALRSSKLPQPERLPNAGSFFKNPWVDAEHYQQLRQQFPQLVAFEDGDGYKLAAGWLIDQAGWKGVQRQGVGVHQHQALVLTHHGGSDGARLLALAQDIQCDIKQRYGVDLEIEPRIYRQS